LACPGPARLGHRRPGARRRRRVLPALRPGARDQRRDPPRRRRLPRDGHGPRAGRRRSGERMSVLLTGSTGFVGMEVLARLLRVAKLADRVAARRGLRRFVHVSTAYVAGRHRGLFAETDLWTGQEFRNSYEQSKAEAEELVRRRGDRFPAVVVRPSIVVGDSATGWTPTFNVLYWPLRAFARGLLRSVPARPDGRVAVVPVDYAASAAREGRSMSEITPATTHSTAATRNSRSKTNRAASTTACE